MKRPLSVLYVLPSLRIGGTEKHVVALASGLPKDRFSTSVCTVREQGPLGKTLQEAGIPVFHIDVNSSWSPRVTTRLRTIMKKRQVDILHTYLFGFGFHASLAARRSGVPVMVSSRREIPVWKKFRHRTLENLNNRLVDCVVACSSHVADYVLETERIASKKLCIVYNGTSLQQGRQTQVESLTGLGLPTDLDGPFLVCVASLTNPKNHGMLVRAFEQISKEIPEARLLLVGEGPQKPKLELLARQLGLDSRIHFAGQVEDIRLAYSIASLCVLTSVREGLPNFLMEAMAFGIPVVTTEAGGASELVLNNETGKVVEQGDVDGFSQAVIELLQNNENARAMGLAGRKRIKQFFSMNRMLQTYQDLYERLWKAKHGP